MTGLNLTEIESYHGREKILNAIDLHIYQGEFHVLLGPSGCGKTTLLRAIAGLQPISSGNITLNHRRIDLLPPGARDLAMVFQHYALFPNMTVRQNLAFGLQRKKMARAQINAKVDAMLDMVNLESRADHLPAQLSGGQRQRVALARALIVEPQLLLLDEPLSALDAQIRKKLQVELKRLQARLGLTAILVTHDQDEALLLGERISILNQGKIVQTDTANHIFHAPQSQFVAQFLGEANILPSQTMRPFMSPHYQQHVQSQNSRLVIHPACMLLGPQNNAALTIQARIDDIQLKGQMIRMIATTNNQDQQELRLDCINSRSQTLPQIGEKITLSVASEDIHILNT